MYPRPAAMASLSSSSSLGFFTVASNTEISRVGWQAFGFFQQRSQHDHVGNLRRAESVGDLRRRHAYHARLADFEVLREFGVVVEDKPARDHAGRELAQGEFIHRDQDFGL